MAAVGVRRLALLWPLGDHRVGTDVDAGTGRSVVGGRTALEPGITDVAFADGSVWVVDASGVVIRIDALTDEIQAGSRSPAPVTTAGWRLGKIRCG